MDYKVGQTISGNDFNKTYKVGQTISADQFNKTYAQSSFPKEESADAKQSFFQKIGGVAAGVGNALTSSEQGVGKSLSTGIIPHLGITKEAQAATDQNKATATKLLQDIRQAKTEGKDTSHLEHAYQVVNGGQNLDELYKALNPDAGKSTKQALGEVLGTALDVLSAGSYGEAAKGAETGKLLTKSPTIMSAAEKIGLGVTKKIPLTIEELAAKNAGNAFVKAGKTIAKGAAQGYGYDISGNLQADKENIFKPGGGALIGGGIPLAVEATKGLGFIAKTVAKYTASGLSGTPVAAIEEAFKNPDAVQKAITSAAGDHEGAAQRILDDAHEALSNLQKARQEVYQQGLAKLEKEATYTKNGQLYVKRVLTDAEAKATKGYIPGTKIGVPTKLTTNGIKNVFTTTLKDFGAEGGGKGGLDYTNVALDDTHLAKLDKLQERVYNWTDTTPTGLNRLRQVVDSYKLGGINLGSSESKFNKIVGDLRTNLSTYLGERVPQVAEMNSKYAAESKVIENINNQLKLNAKDPNTALRKLLNVFNPKSVVYKPMVEQLGEKGAKGLMADIAGLTMSKWTPEGLAKYFDLSGGALAAIVNPHALLAAPLASPKAVGLATATAGKIAQNKTAQNIVGAVSKTATVARKLGTRQAGLKK